MVSNRSRPRLRRWVACTAAMLLLTSCDGCSEEEFGELAELKDVLCFIEAIVTSPLKQRLSDRALAFVARRGATDTSARLRVPYDLWAGFHLSALCGAFDGVEQGHAGAVFGVEIQERGVPTPTVFGLHARLVGDDVQVTATSNGEVLNQRTLVGFRRVELDIEHTGANVVFRVRPRQPLPSPGGVFQGLAIADHVQTAPFNAVLTITGLAPGAPLHFDELRISANGTAPAPVPPAHAAVNLLFEAGRDMADAALLIDSVFVLDTAGASAELGTAIEKLDAAEDAILALPGAGKASPESKAAKLVAKARAALVKARSSLDRREEFGINGAMKQILRKAARSTIRAGASILPAELRE